MRAFSTIPPKTMVETFEMCLSRLGYKYRKSQGRFVTEFEVVAPAQFIASVEILRSQGLSFIIPRGAATRSAVEIRPLIGGMNGAGEPESSARALASELLSALPSEPWKGTGMFRWKAERSNWQRLAEF